MVSYFHNKTNGDLSKVSSIAGELESEIGKSGFDSRMLHVIYVKIDCEILSFVILLWHVVTKCEGIWYW